MKAKTIMPTTWLLVAILGMIALHFLLPVMKIIPAGWNLAGVIPLMIGVILNLIADKAFHQAKTTVKPFEESSVLVTDGVFRITRNPMYLGFVLILIGIGVLLGSAAPLIVIAVYAFLLDRMYIRVEEGMLAEKFGAAWQAYRRQVRRWV